MAPLSNNPGHPLVLPGKELEIKLPLELPTAVTFRAWKNAVVAAVIGASHRSDLAAPWTCQGIAGAREPKSASKKRGLCAQVPKHHKCAHPSHKVVAVIV